MRVFIISLALLSTAIASSTNIINILNQNRSTLLNMKVGMSYTVENKEQDLDFDLNGNIRVVNNKSNEFATILKIDGTKVYAYIETTTPPARVITKHVELIEVDLSQDSDFTGMTFTNTKVKDNILSTNFATQITDPDSGIVISATGKFSKNLKTAAFCDIAMAQTSKLNLMGTRYTLKDSFANKCSVQRTIEEVKAIDLSSITFCDMTIEDVDNCTDSMDLRHLTSQL